MAKQRSKKNSSGGNKWFIISVVLAFLTIGAYFMYRAARVERAKFVKYPAFAIDIPDNYDLHGIDVSRYQSIIDWKSVKEMKVDNIRIHFAFIKATEGLGNVDRQFKRNWKKSREAGVTRGAYHFFLATKSGRIQAENFIKNVDLQPGDLPPVLDIEQLHGVRPEKMRKEIKDWLDIVEEHYGVKPILYTYVNFYSRYLDGAFDEYPLWAAHYMEKNKPKINRSWIFWQHSEKGRVNGITRRVDFNVFNGSTSDFEDLLLQ